MANPEGLRMGTSKEGAARGAAMARAPRGGRLSLLGLAAVLVLRAAPAAAVVDVNKSFAPINVVPGQTSTMTISLFNSATAAAGGTQFVDTLPANVTVVAPVSNGCGGSLSVAPATQVSLSGGTIPAGDGINSGRCDVVVTVRSTIPGTYVNTLAAGSVTTTDQGSNPQAANATLTVSPFLALTGTKAFSPNVLHVDPAGVSTVTITLTNPNTQLPLTNVSFTDSLPAPLEISSPVTTGGTCGGAFTDGAAGTLDPADTSFRVTGASLPAGGSCTVTVQVRVRASEANVARNGNVTNTIGAGAVTTTEGPTTSAAFSGSVTVQTGAAIVKSFAPATVTVGGTSTLTFTLRNYNLAAVSPADFVDVMPAGITVVGPASTTCGGSATFTGTQVQLAGGTIPAATSATTSNFGSCTVTATVRGDTVGSLVNNIPTGSFGTVAYSTTGATLTVNPAATSVSAAKAFSPATVVQSQATTLTITLSNAGGLNAAITSFADNLTTLGTGFTVAASPAASTTCGGSLGAVAGSTSVTLSGGSIPAGGNCTITVPVAVAPNASTGARTNTIAAGALVTDQGSNAFGATASLTVTQAATVAKSWNPTTVLSGGVSRLTITVSHANGAIAFTNMGLTDLLTSMGAGFVVSAAPNVFNNCGGTVTATALTTSIALAGGSLGTGATTCQIRVDVQTPAAGAPGSYRNRIVANNLSTAEGFTYNANADANLTLQAAPAVTLNKAFTPVVTNGGAPSVASVTIANNKSGAIALTNVSLVDLLPPNVEVYSVPAASFTGTGCSGATISAAPFGTQIGISGASIAANSTCTLSVNVTAYVDGNHVNDIPIGALTSAQGVTNDNQPSATLTILRNVNVAKSFSPNVVEVGGSSTLTLRISNTNTVPRTLANPGLVDTLPGGVTVAGVASTTCPGSTVDAPVGGGTVTVRNGTLAASSSCTVTVPVTVGATGTYVNTIAANTLATVEGSTNPDPATDTLRAVAKPTIAKAFAPASIPAGGTSTITFTLSNPNNGILLPGGLTGAAFSDTLTGMAISANQNAAGTCAFAGTNSFVTGQTALSFSGLTIPAGSPGTCTVTVVVSAPSPGVFPNATSGVLTNQTQTPGNPSPSVDLTVLAGPPSIAKDFSPTTILGGGTSVLTFTLSNPNAVAATLATPAFTDVFPTSPGAMTLASTMVSSTCGGTVVDSGGGALNVGDVGVRLNGGSIPAGGSCTVSVTVTAGVPGTYANTSSTLASTNAGTSASPATASLTVSAQADLSLLKTISNPTPFVGSMVAFTVAVTNAGPAPADGVTVRDLLPAGYTFVGAIPLQGTYSDVTGIWNVGTVGVGATTSVAIQATVNLTGPWGTNVAEVMTSSLPDPDSTPGNGNPAEDDYASAAAVPVPAADLSITKTDGVATAVPGGVLTYTLVASNAGPLAVTGATVADIFPAMLTGVTWTCVAAGGATCTASGSGNISDTVNLPVGATVTYTVTATVSATATGTLANTATVTAPGGVSDPTPGNNTATDTDTLSPTADLSITKTDGVTTVVPGNSVTYTIVASNAGPSAVTGVTVADTFPAVLTSPTWTCVGAGGGACTASGSGNISDTVNLPVGASVTYTVTATLSATATGTLANTATVAAPGGVTDPTPGNNSATDTDTINPAADLSITKTDGVTTVVPGNSVTYTITARNVGPSAVTGATVADTFPATLTSVAWTCVAAGGGTCTASGSGSISDTVNLPAGASVTYTVTATLSATATGTLVNTATVAAPGGVTDPTPGNNSATDTDTINPTADLTITKSDGVATVIPGNNVTYTIVASNAGPSAVTGATVADTFPATLTGVTWTCVAAGGGTCTAAGSGNISDTVNLPVGATVTYTVSATVSATATGTLANTATVAAPGGVTDPTPGNNTATDTDTLSPTADLSITKTDGVTTVVPGNSVTYTITARNVGPSAVTGTTVADTFPAVLASPTWTCVGAGGGTCTAAGSGNISDTVNLPVGATVTYTVTATLSATATGTLANTATVTAPGGVTDPTPGNNSATDTDTLNPTADLSITKTDGVATVIPGNNVTYTIVASNAGPSAVTGATVADTFPATLTGVTWTCVAAGGGTCTAAGSGNISDTVNLPVGASVTYTVTATLSATATGTLVNTATVTAPGGVTDPTPGNNTATDTDTLSPTADLSITKTDGVTTVVPGNSVTYTITARNVGPSAVTGATVADTFPATLTGVTWTCVAAGGGSCTASGSGNINDTANLPVGATVTYTVSATVSATATGTLANTATVAAPGGVTDPAPGNNTATDTDTLSPTADLSITKTDGVTTVVPGNSVSYTIVASNAGPSAVTGATVADTFPATLTSVAWTCVAAGGGTCTASGSGNISDTVNLPVGATVTYTVTATLSASATGTLVNTATVAAPGGVTDPTPGNNSATDTDTLNPTADLTITKTDGVATVIPGNNVTYTIVASNVGPSAVTGATVADTFPATLTGVTWTCVAAGGGTCTASGSGNISDTVNLPVGATVTYTVTAALSATATGTLVNTATVTAPGGVTDPTPGNNTATDTDTLVPRADLHVVKTGPGSATAGTNVTFSLAVGNDGPSDATGVSVTDPTPAGLVFASASAPCAGGFPCAIGDLASGATVNLTVTYSIPAGYTAPDPIVNTASVAGDQPDPDPSDNTSTSSTAVGRVPSADLGVVKSGPATGSAGSTVTYALVVTNHGPDDAAGVVLTDPTPAGLTFLSASAPCAGGFPCALGTLNAGAGVPVSVTFTVPAGYTAPDPIVNVATVSTTTADPNPANDSDSASTSLGADPVDLSVVKSGPASVNAGNDVTFGFLVRNAGPATATSVQLADPTPAGLSFVSASAPCAGGFPCALGTLSAGATVSLTATFNVPAGYAGTNPIANTATVSSTEPDASPGNNTSTATVGVGSESADIAVVKTGPVTAVPGSTVTWQITVRNLGPGSAQGVSLADPTPAGLAFVSAAAPCAGGFPCSLGTLAAGSSVTVAATFAVPGGYTSPNPVLNTATVTSTTPDGNPANDTSTASTPLAFLADLAVLKSDGSGTFVPGGPVTWTITVTNNGPSTVTSLTLSDPLPPALTGAVFAPSTGSYDSVTGAWTGLALAAGQSVTLTLTGVVSPAATGPLVNTAVVAPPAGVTDPNHGNDTSTDTDLVDARVDLSVTKTDGLPTYTPGGTTVYTIVVANAGPSDAFGATVSDPLPAGITTASWSCTPSAGSACTANGTGAIADTVTVRSGGTLTYALTLTIPSDRSGSLVNTAAVAPPSGVTDATPGNDTATDTDTPSPVADLVVTKTASAASVAVGSDFDYRITVLNQGPSDATNVVLSDPLPAGLLFVSATSTRGTCSGAGTVTCSIGLLAPGARADIVLRARAMTSGTIVNTATATLDQTDPTPPNNTATAPLDAVGEAVVPTVSGIGLLALAVLVAAAGILLLRRSFPAV